MHHNIHKHDLVIRTLHLIQDAGFESAIIGGGAVRDIYFEILPRDIDIFLWDPRYSNEAIEPNLRFITDGNEVEGHAAIWSMLKLREGRFGPADDDVQRIYSNYGNSRVTAIWNVMKSYIPFQLIFLQDKPIDYLNNYFDFGLCKCYCDGVKFRFTPDFTKDAKQKTITFVAKDLSETEYNYAHEVHLPRLKEKFPGFTYQVAPWNANMVAKFGSK